MTTDALVRVLVVDDHQVFTDLLGPALDAQPDLVCVGPARDAATARRLAAAHPFDVAVVDVHLPDADGIDLAARLMASRPAGRVIVLTGLPRHDLSSRAAALGASGFLSKDGSLSTILTAIRSGTPTAPVWCGADVLSGLPDAAGLSPRELDVLALLGEGKDPATIARSLGIGLSTSRDHVKSIRTKLGVTSQLQAVVTAQRAGLLRVGS